MNYEHLPNCSCFAIFFEIATPANVETMWQSVCTLFDDLSVPIERVVGANGRSVQASRATISRMLARNEINVTGGTSLAPLKSYDWRACGHFHAGLRSLFFGFEAQSRSEFQGILDDVFLKLASKLPGARYGFIFNRAVGLNPVAYVSGMNSIETDPADRDLRMVWSNSLAIGCEHLTIRDVFETNCLMRSGASAKLAEDIQCLVKNTDVGSMEYFDDLMVWHVPKYRLIEARNLLIGSGIIKTAQWIRDIYSGNMRKAL